jgi:hypothetical protein
MAHSNQWTSWAVMHSEIASRCDAQYKTDENARNYGIAQVQ